MLLHMHSNIILELQAAITSGNDKRVRNIFAAADTALLDESSRQELKKLSARYLPGNSSRLSLIKNRVLKPGISLVTACMNRNLNLIHVIRGWLALDVDEIIIVDWSSSRSVKHSLKESGISDTRIRIIRVENEEQWVLTHAFNLGLQLVNYDKTYKLDSDIAVTPKFLELNHFGQGEFIRGFWKTAIDANRHDQMFINGSLGGWTKDLIDAGLYDERIQSYGWDDSDLYRRLVEKCGLVHRFLAIDSIEHLHQNETQRTSNQDINPHYFLDVVRPTILNNVRNRFLTEMQFGVTPISHSDYQLNYESEDMIYANRISRPQETPKYILDMADKLTALHFLNLHASQAMQRLGEHSTLLASLAWLCFKSNLPFSAINSLMNQTLSDDFEWYDSHPKSLSSHVHFSRAQTIFIRSEQSQVLNWGGLTVIVITPEITELIHQIRMLLGHEPLASNAPIVPKELLNQALDTRPKLYCVLEKSPAISAIKLSQAKHLANSLNIDVVTVWDAESIGLASYHELFNGNELVIPKLPTRTGSKLTPMSTDALETIKADSLTTDILLEPFDTKDCTSTVEKSALDLLNLQGALTSQPNLAGQAFSIGLVKNTKKLCDSNLQTLQKAIDHYLQTNENNLLLLIASDDTITDKAFTSDSRVIHLSASQFKSKAHYEAACIAAIALCKDTMTWFANEDAADAMTLLSLSKAARN